MIVMQACSHEMSRCIICGVANDAGSGTPSDNLIQVTLTGSKMARRTAVLRAFMSPADILPRKKKRLLADHSNCWVSWLHPMVSRPTKMGYEATTVIVDVWIASTDCMIGLPDQLTTVPLHSFS